MLTFIVQTHQDRNVILVRFIKKARAALLEQAGAGVV
jgi:hypothetical protein